MGGTMKKAMSSKPIINEAQLQAWIRLEAPKLGSILLRNNSGVLFNPETRRPIRFGLGNDSSAVNAVFKSSDLIGVTPRTCDCGRVHGVFTALEVKAPGFKYRPNDQTQTAQMNFINIIRQHGGLADFISSPDDLHRVLKS